MGAGGSTRKKNHVAPENKFIARHEIEHGVLAPPPLPQDPSASVNAGQKELHMETRTISALASASVPTEGNQKRVSDCRSSFQTELRNTIQFLRTAQVASRNANLNSAKQASSIDKMLRMLSSRPIVDLVESMDAGGASNTTHQSVISMIHTDEKNHARAPTISRKKPVGVSDAVAAKKIAAPAESFQCFIPQLVAREIFESQRNSSSSKKRKNSFTATEEKCTEFESAVLFADMSGFTALTERLSGKPNGAERMCGVLNGFFGALLRVVKDYGGDCVKFAGDALCILWPVVHGNESGPHTLKEAVICGTRCSESIHKQLSGYPAKEGVKLTMHMGMGAGTVTTLYVGGLYNRWEYVVAGPPLAQIGVAEPLAGSGETVFSPEAWSHVEDVCAGWHLDAPNEEYVKQGPFFEGKKTQLEFAADCCINHEHIPLTRSFIPNAIYQQLNSGYNSYLAEMRELSVLFIKIDLPVTGSESLRHTHQMMVAVQKATYQYEGSVNKLLVDDKGTLMLVAYGLPPLAHEDDPVRAIAAAFSMRRGLNSMGLRLSVGITTGDIFCGVVGSDLRREYTVMGDSVNLSARLMGAAQENEVLVDENTAMRALECVQFETLPPLQVKGKVRAVRVFRPTVWLNGQQRGNKKKTKGVVNMLGRQHECEKVGRMLDKLIQELKTPNGLNLQRAQVAEEPPSPPAPPCRTIFILGDHGVGKTTFSHVGLGPIARKKGMLLIGSHSGTGDFLELMPGRMAASTQWSASLKALNVIPSFKAWEACIVQAIMAVHPRTVGSPLAGPSKRIKDSFFSHDVSQACRNKLYAILPETKHEDVPLLSELLPGLQLQMDERCSGLNEDEQRTRRLDLLACVLLQAGTSCLPPQPILAVLDDVTTLDDFSWELISHLNYLQDSPGSSEYSMGAGLAVCCISRPMHRNNLQFHRFNTLKNAARDSQFLLELGALPDKAFQSFIHSCLGVPPGDPMPQEMVQYLKYQSRGNPHFAMELVKHLLSEQAIFITDKQCFLNNDIGISVEDVGIPRTLSRIVKGMLDRLTTHEQMVVKIASVLPQPFTLAQLYQSFDEDEDGLAVTREQMQNSSQGQALDDLVDEGILVSSNKAGLLKLEHLDPDGSCDTHYAFDSPIVRIEANRLLLDAQKQAILARHLGK